MKFAYALSYLFATVLASPLPTSHTEHGNEARSEDISDTTVDVLSAALYSAWTDRKGDKLKVRSEDISDTTVDVLSAALYSAWTDRKGDKK
ncbi:hypothetical protein B0H67DRAFT_650144 [Lasiosphaeris hirsuta]|uniref:Uncharacterized protein n=1 Tax=Lasiosphaeris hirsuta TaxID=260670 RepID=A0AA40DK33_9PEZI|nr:hypothetical protein B0H67DRAFT_650144 [Lasiosphaeris hirsuta]